MNQLIRMHNAWVGALVEYGVPLVLVAVRSSRGEIHVFEDPSFPGLMALLE